MKKFAISLAIVLMLALSADAKSRGGGGFRSSSPSRSYSAPKTTYRAPAPKATPAPKAAVAGAAGVVSSKSGDSASKAQDRASSASAFKASKPTPKATESVSKGFNTRDTRKTETYKDIPAEKKTVIVNNFGGRRMGDSYDGLFMHSLMSMSIANQAMFHHNHWNSYSETRRAQLLAENAALKAQMATITTPRDPSYVPAGVDADLIYSDAAARQMVTPVAKQSSNTLAIVFLSLAMGGVFFAIYYVFIRKESF